MKFASIVPTEYIMEFSRDIDSACNLTLAHIIEQNDYSESNYIARYCSLHTPDRFTIMDNSAFEMHTQNKPLFPAEKLLSLGKKVGADYIVLPDYPGENSNKTINAGLMYAEQFKQAGFGTFFVPQGEIGNVEQWISSFAWAACSPLIDYIGISIIATPNAYSIERNKLQNYLSRFTLMRELYFRGLLNLARAHGKKIHMLGMNEGPNEINLMDAFNIDSWDSSAPGWAGLNGIIFDNSPTGLTNGKFHLPVDFSFKTTDNSLIERAKYNHSVINNLVEDYNDRHKTA